MINQVWQQWTTPKIHRNSLLQRMHLDSVLLLGITMLLVVSLFILYSASNEDVGMLERQGLRIFLAYLGMIVLAQIPPDKYRFWGPWIYILTIILLIAVLVAGELTQGARRWLDIGLFRFQPSELMKLCLPVMVAWYFREKLLPPNIWQIFVALVIIIVPTALIAKQPDLGTALVIAASGACVLLLAGVSWRLIFGIGIISAAIAPLAWHFMHDYQRQRVLTFLDPENDPLGKGYHIIQSKIAIGSGGLFGKGWLHGTQSHLQFLPEHATDFIFAVCGEELGLIGCGAIILLYLFIIGRCVYITSQAQDTFTRLLGGSLTLTFFLSMFINMGMVIGILPVVGVPLPLISFGGTAVVTFMASFGILMSIHSHRKLLGN